MKKWIPVLAFVALSSLAPGASTVSGLRPTLPVAKAAPAAAGLPVPERGFLSSDPGRPWEQGLLSGNGTIGASVLGEPLDEIVIFSHKRMFVPERAPLLPPATGTRLFEIRRLIERGLYAQAAQLSVDVVEQKGFLYPDPLMPAFDLRIKMVAEGPVSDYMRSTDFPTGETTVRGGRRGAFERRLFVSRADGVVVLRITGSGPGHDERSARAHAARAGQPAVQGRRQQRRDVGRRRVADVPQRVRQGLSRQHPGLGGRGPGGRQGGGFATPQGSALAVTDADEVLILLDIAMMDDAKETRIEATKAALARLAPDYAGLLARHEKIHGAMFGRMRLDLGGGADRALTSEELLAKTTDAEPSRALIEKVFDAGRYNIISSVSDLPPTLQGVWAGTYDPPWASDFTHNGNVPSAIASLLMGNTPELMTAYTPTWNRWCPTSRSTPADVRGPGHRPALAVHDERLQQRFRRLVPRPVLGGRRALGRPFLLRLLAVHRRPRLPGPARPALHGKGGRLLRGLSLRGPGRKYVFSPTQSPENAPGTPRTR